MRRREFITLVGCAAAWPVAVRAQQAAMPVVGFLHSAKANTFAGAVTAFRQGLSETGHIVGSNVAIEFRWAEENYEQLPELAADLVQRQVAVIVTGGGLTALLTVKAATAAIPIVFLSGGDPVRRGLVASLNRSGGNLTGVHQFTAELEPKRLGLLHELAPAAAMIAVLLNQTNPTAEIQSKAVREAAHTIGQQINILHAGTEREIDTAFATMIRLRAGALHVGADPFFNSRRDQIVALAARHAIPAIYEWREFAAAGGLASYGTSLTDAWRQVGAYAGRVLNGEKPADMPVMQSSKFEFVINLKTARTLGLGVPGSLSARADEVIE